MNHKHIIDQPTTVTWNKTITLDWFSIILKQKPFRKISCCRVCSLQKEKKTKNLRKQNMSNRKQYKQTGTARNTSLKTTYDTRYQSSQEFEVFSRVHWYGLIGGWIPTDEVFCSIDLVTVSVMSEGKFKWCRQVQIELVITSYSSKWHYLYDISSRKYVVMTRSIPFWPAIHFLEKYCRHKCFNR